MPEGAAILGRPSGLARYLAFREVERCMWRLIVVLLILPAWCVGMTAWDDQAAPTATTSPAKAPRVILIVNRNVEVQGFVESEDDEVITFRTIRGEVQTLAKSRILHIVRLVEPQPGQTGMVVLRDGQTREGIILEDGFDYVLMDIQGIRAKLRRETVSHVVLEPTFEERYAQAKAAIAADNYHGMLMLSQWLAEQRRYDLARDELLSLLEKTEMPEARKLLTTVEAQLALNDPVVPSADPATTAPDATTEPSPDKKHSGPVYPADILPDKLISMSDVNIIRVYEIDFDHPPRVTIGPDTIRTLIESYGTSKLIPSSQTGRTAMFRAEPINLVRLMFELRARELYPQIQVNTEPYSLNLFRRRVHDTWLINNCATSRCHGGVEGAPFFLHARNFKDERVRYTNMLILERLELDPEWPLVNFDKPEDSLILQFGLSRESARKPHPKVPGWKPVFTDTSHNLWQGGIEWIRSMMVPRPAYPVDYEPVKLARPLQSDGQPVPAADERQPR